MSCSEWPTCYGVSIRKARKEHICCECRGIIHTGERYNYHHGVWNGKAASYKVCFDCDDLRYKIDEDVNFHDERTPFTCLADSVFDSDDTKFKRIFNAIKRKRKARGE